jgi:uncharacterized protein YidB (DUF937 family)
MARGMPSMVALLGLLALAGYQNRDKLADALGRINKNAGPGDDRDGGGLLGSLGGLLGGATGGSVLSGGIGDLVERFKQTGQSDAADSWVSRGPNKPVSTGQLEQALGADVIDTLVQKTGLSREDLLSRLSDALPQAVDAYTPEGRVPTQDEAARLI